MFILFFVKIFSSKVIVFRQTKPKYFGIKVVSFEYGLNHIINQKNITIGKSFFLRCINKD